MHPYDSSSSNRRNSNRLSRNALTLNLFAILRHLWRPNHSSPSSLERDPHRQIETFESTSYASVYARSTLPPSDAPSSPSGDTGGPSDSFMSVSIRHATTHRCAHQPINHHAEHGVGILFNPRYRIRAFCYIYLYSLVLLSIS